MKLLLKELFAVFLGTWTDPVLLGIFIIADTDLNLVNAALNNYKRSLRCKEYVRI